MMKLEVNLKVIEEKTVHSKDENIAFTNFLMTQDAEEIDKVVHQLNDEITPKIDCLECGNCCKNLRPAINPGVLEQFITPENMDKYKYAEAFPCKNLNGNACTVYENRPGECRSFPYLDRPNFTSRKHEIMQNIKICPIVFNVFEGLKEELMHEI